jgi:hypothetical protein
MASVTSEVDCLLERLGYAVIAVFRRWRQPSVERSCWPVCCASTEAQSLCRSGVGTCDAWSINFRICLTNWRGPDVAREEKFGSRLREIATPIGDGQCERQPKEQQIQLARLDRHAQHT